MAAAVVIGSLKIWFHCEKFEVVFGGQGLLDQQAARSEIDRPAPGDQLLAKGAEGVRLARTRLPENQPFIVDSKNWTTSRTTLLGVTIREFYSWFSFWGPL